MTQTALDPHTIHTVQMMVRDLIKDKVCELESQASEVAADMPHYSKQLAHAARELDHIQLSVFLFLVDVWNESTEQQLRITRPQLPQVTPLSQTEVV